MNRARAWDMVAESRVAVLSTITPNGLPHAVPCVLALHGDTVYTPVDAKPKRTRALQRLRNLEHSPAATLLVHDWHEEWSRLRWVRLRGTARLVSDPTELAHARRLLMGKYPQYRRAADLDPVIAVDVEDWRAWAAAG